VAKRDGDRDHVRPLPPWVPIKPADEFGEQVVGIQLLDDQLQECARPRECPRACGEEPQHARTKLTPPSLGIELLFGPLALFQVVIDVGDEATDLAHGSSSTNDGARERTRADRCGGPGQSARLRWV
jgi:hypothetical protein